MSLQLFKASAGSGKTYTLAQKYLLLVIQHPTSYQRILAITFTRKATAEMKSRILQELAALANGQASKQLNGLLSHLNQGADVFTEARVRQQARQALELLLGDYSKFSISTIDSFCQQIVRAFALESGLSYGYNIELDQDKVLNTVADDLLLLAGQDASTTKLMLDFALKQLEDNRRWDFREQLVGLASNLLKEDFNELRTYINTHPEAEQQLEQLKKRMTAQAKAFELTLTDLGKEMMALVEQQGLKPVDFMYKYSGPINFPLKLSNGIFAPAGSRAQSAAQDPGAWFGKKGHHLASDSFLAQLTDLQQKAIQIMDVESPRYLTARLIRKNAFGLGLMSKLLGLVQTYKTENNVQLMHDVNALLKVVIEGNDAPFIYEKVGSRYQHYFLDEFQDTSMMQWHNLRPLLFEGLAQGQESLIVGDVKQSIYRFRGGDWQLLGRQLGQEIDPETLKVQNLTNNFRSTRTIIDFNNDLFQVLPSLLADFHQESVLTPLAEKQDPKLAELKDLSAAMVNAYDGAQQYFPDSKVGQPALVNGWAQVRVHTKAEPSAQPSEQPSAQPDDQEADGLENAKLPLKELPQTIIDIQRCGFDAADIAILVRTNAQGQAIANTLQAVKAGPIGLTNPDVVFDVISSDSLFLRNSTSVQLVVAAFRWLQSADEGLACSVVVGLWRQFQGITNPTNQFDWALTMPKLSRSEHGWLRWANQFLPSRLVEGRLRMMQQSAYDVAEQLVDMFGLSAGGELAYIQGLLDVVLGYGRNNPNDLRSFLKWWDEEGNGQSLKIAGRQNAITIITLHKAKGLEYPVVLMPFVDWSLLPRTGTTLLAQSNPDALQGLPGLPLAYGNELKDSLFAADHAQETLQNSFDALNFLYVALTRACQVLKIWMPSPYKKTGEPTKTINALVIQALIQTRAISQEEAISGCIKNFGQLGHVIPPTPHESSSSISLHTILAGNTTNRLVVKADARKFLQEHTGIGTTDDGESYRDKKIKIGNQVHLLLSRLTDIDDLQREADKPYFAGDLDLADKQGLATMVNELMQLPEMRQWFRPGIRALTEANLMLPTGKLRRPDRVIILPDETLVIDFKTGKANEAHRKQILGYMDHLLAMGHTKVKGHLVYLQTKQIVDVYAA